MRSGVPLDIVSGIVAGATLSALAAADSRAAAGGAHRETSASSRGASSQPETLSARVDSRSVASGVDWPSAEAQNNNASGKHGEIRARYIICPRSLLGRVPAVAFKKLRYSRSQHALSTLALNRKVLAALPATFGNNLAYA